MPPSKSSPLIPGAVLTLLAGGGLFAYASESDAAVPQLERWTAATERAVLSAPRSRPVFGEQTGGNAFDDYRAVLGRVRELAVTDEPSQRLARESGDREFAGSVDWASLAQRWAPVLDELCSATRRAEARQPNTLPQGFAAEISHPLDARLLVGVVALRAEAMLAEGRAREAVDLLLDTAVFCVDLSQALSCTEQMCGQALIRRVTSGFWSERRLDTLDEQALAALAEGLAAVDGALPLFADIRCDMVRLGHSVLGTSVESLGGGLTGAVAKGMLADGLLAFADRLRDEQASRTQPWPERAETLQTIDAFAQDRDVLVPSLVDLERTQRETLAGSRALRLIVADRRGLPLPELQDPLGDGVLVFEAACELARAASSREADDAAARPATPR